MKKAILLLLAVFVLGGAEAASAQATNQESVTIGVNKSQKALDRKVTIKVLMVVEDSRCPEGTTCVQAGNAKVRLSIQKGTDESKIFELNTNGENTAKVENFEITLDGLNPAPKSAAPIKQKDYVASLTVKQV